MQTVSDPQGTCAYNWSPYYRARIDCGPSPLAIEVKDRFGPFHSGIDLGCGTCVDSMFFLKYCAVEMTGVDSFAESLAHSYMASMRFGHRFRFESRCFRELRLEPRSYDLVFSNFSLPYYGRDGFGDFVRSCVEATKEDGLFAANFHGEKSWMRGRMSGTVFISRDELEQIFEGFCFEIIESRREDEDGVRHRYDVFAQRG